MANLSDLLGLKTLSAGLATNPTGINFSGRLFSEPTFFNTCIPPAESGLYAIMVSDLRCRPKPYRVIYFGHAEDLYDRVNRRHEKYQSWCREAGASPLHVSFHALHAKLLRVVAEGALIKDYRPACNIQGV